MDNGKQFDCTIFREFFQHLGTKLCFASVYHPQSNGAVERANGVIFAGIKKNITEQPNGKWVDELPKVIWSHNTTESRATKFTPFKLLYGEEAMTPEELLHRSYRTEASNEDIKPTIDTIEAIKTQAVINLGRYQEETRRWRNKKVRPREIKEGDLVLRRIPKSKQQGKMHGTNGKVHSWSLRWQDPRLAGFVHLKESKSHTPRTKTCFSATMSSFPRIFL